MTPGTAAVPQEYKKNSASLDATVAYGLPGKPGYTYTRPFDYFSFQATASTENAWTGFAFPLTMNGSRGVVSNCVRDPFSTTSVASTCPGCAFAITRAARFTASPMTVYVRL